MNKFEETELSILRSAVDKISDDVRRTFVNSTEVKAIISIVEMFLRDNKLICYGGTAINNILPDDDQFYDKNLEIPDYDFFSKHAMKHAKQLADLYVSQGYSEVEAKAGVHHGTYKVFVNFIAVADITQIPREVFRNLSKECLYIDQICYAPPNFLRMAMYLELSRPLGDVSRWEKVLKRLIVLNKHYPMKNMLCKKIHIGRDYHNPIPSKQQSVLFNLVRTLFINSGAVFFGSYAFKLYTKYMPTYLKKWHRNVLDFDVLVTDSKKTAQYMVHELKSHGFSNVSFVNHKGVGENIPVHCELKHGKETLAFIYETSACHSYNEFVVRGDAKLVKVATIDTILSLYLAFLFSDRPYFDKDRLLCLAQFLFVLQQKNRLKQVGLLKRFSTTCYGTQQTLDSIRTAKTRKYEELKKNKRLNTTEFDTWFLKYAPKTKKKYKKQ